MVEIDFNSRYICTECKQIFDFYKTEKGLEFTKSKSEPEGFFCNCMVITRIATITDHIISDGLIVKVQDLPITEILYHE